MSEIYILHHVLGPITRLCESPSAAPPASVKRALCLAAEMRALDRFYFSMGQSVPYRPRLVSCNFIGSKGLFPTVKREIMLAARK